VCRFRDRQEHCAREGAETSLLKLEISRIVHRNGGTSHSGQEIPASAARMPGGDFRRRDESGVAVPLWPFPVWLRTGRCSAPPRPGFRRLHAGRRHALERGPRRPLGSRPCARAATRVRDIPNAGVSSGGPPSFNPRGVRYDSDGIEELVWDRSGRGWCAPLFGKGPEEGLGNCGKIVSGTSGRRASPPSRRTISIRRPTWPRRSSSLRPVPPIRGDDRAMIDDVSPPGPRTKRTGN
jgi:hypothetical protein